MRFSRIFKQDLEPLRRFRYFALAMANAKKEETYYVVTFRDPKENNEIVTLKAKTIHDSTLGLSFICISDFVFSESAGPVVNPTEENLKKRFAGTKSLHMLIYNILSIEEVGKDHKGLAFEKDKSNLVMIAPEGMGDLPPPPGH